MSRATPTILRSLFRKKQNKRNEKSNLITLQLSSSFNVSILNSVNSRKFFVLYVYSSFSLLSLCGYRHMVEGTLTTDPSPSFLSREPPRASSREHRHKIRNIIFLERRLSDLCFYFVFYVIFQFFFFSRVRWHSWVHTRRNETGRPYQKSWRRNTLNSFPFISRFYFGSDSHRGSSYVTPQDSDISPAVGRKFLGVILFENLPLNSDKELLKRQTESLR